MIIYMEELPARYESAYLCKDELLKKYGNPLVLLISDENVDTMYKATLQNYLMYS